MNTTELGANGAAGNEAKPNEQGGESKQEPRRSADASPEGQEREPTLPGALVPPPFEQQETPFTD